MIDRVRAVLITPASQILLIRRERPDTVPYWVLPGGHVEPADRSHEDALRREIREELAGVPEIHSLIQVFEGRADRQYIFLGRIDSWSFEDRTGPEFAESGRGGYRLDLVAANAHSIAAVNLTPAEVAQFLIAALQTATLFTLPDLRSRSGEAHSPIT